MSFRFKDAAATANDGLGKARFFVYDPEDVPEASCHICKTPCYVLVRWDHTLWDTLKTKGIDNLDSPSLIYKFRNRNSPIGITCGCYARFHRQIAHITSRRTHG